MIFFLLLICAMLLAIAVSDFSVQAVEIYWFVGLFVAILGYAISENGWEAVAWQSATNFFLLFGMGSLLALYYFVKEGTIRNIVNQKLGIGDIVFWICLAPLFSTMNLVVFMVLSLLVTLILLLLFSLVKARALRTQPVPLAGFQAVLLLIVLVTNQLMFQYHLYTDLSPIIHLNS